MRAAHKLRGPICFAVPALPECLLDDPYQDAGGAAWQQQTKEKDDDFTQQTAPGSGVPRTR